MAFYSDDDCLNTLSLEDRMEVFSCILLGSSDFTKSLLFNIFSDYGVVQLVILERGN
ncbi:MAG: hypothetical protein WBP08_01815 [Saprospiraceae bacterium]